ncbi:Uncharacterised protein [Yersinia ruckeri]|uniref:hypothetical protein n=1 Tax=Yersinia ruckeri TaxID=29486 RepID=UPI0005DAB215|nr:hypothetical protein [Yersinia ruckeri]ELI6452508.1 hypothetical protein [Yersinia ruckeri]CNB91028.1 Uncharacterised protein [Yersinia ruckeri]
MDNKKINELITSLEKALMLANAIPSTIESWELADKANRLSIQLREIIQSKMSTTHKSFNDINS